MPRPPPPSSSSSSSDSEDERPPRRAIEPAPQSGRRYDPPTTPTVRPTPEVRPKPANRPQTPAVDPQMPVVRPPPPAERPQTPNTDIPQSRSRPRSTTSPFAHPHQSFQRGRTPPPSYSPSEAERRRSLEPRPSTSAAPDALALAVQSILPDSSDPSARKRTNPAQVYSGRGSSGYTSGYMTNNPIPLPLPPPPPKRQRTDEFKQRDARRQRINRAWDNYKRTGLLNGITDPDVIQEVLRRINNENNNNM